MRRPLRKPHGLETGDIDNWEDAMDYIVYSRGANIIAVNGSTGIETLRSTDFATVLQHAIDQFATTPGTIYIKPPGSGVYTVETTVAIPDGTYGLSIVGGGFRWGSEGVVLEAGNNAVSPILEDENGAQGFTTFRNLGFTGQEIAESWDVTGLKAFGQDSHIENCSFHDCGIGLYTRTNPWILNNWIEVCTIGLKISGGSTFVNNNIFWNNTEEDIFLAAEANVYIITNNRANASRHFIRYNKAAGSTDQILIANNVLHSHTDSMILLERTDCSDMIITGNTADGAGTADYFIENEGGMTVTNGLVANNNLRDFETGIISDTTGMTVHGNTGFISENGGATAAIADGATFAHGLSGTPSYCVVIGSVAGDLVSVNALGAANVTVNIKDEGGGAGTAQVIYWRAYL